MLGDISRAQKFCIICGHTDLRAGIDGLRAVISRQYNLNPLESCAFLFCGHRRDRIKVLFWEGDGFCLLYKRFEYGVLKWPRNANEAREITPEQLGQLVSGLSVEQKTLSKRL